MYVKNIQLIWLLFVFSFISCNSDPIICPDYQSPYFRVTLEQLNTEDTVNFLTLRIHNADEYLIDNPDLNDSLYFNYPTAMALPLNNNNNTLELIFDWAHANDYDSLIEIENFSHDTLSITYNSEIFLDNLDCDFYFEYTIDSSKIFISRNEIDSVVIDTTIINDEQLNNIQIFF